MTVKMTKRGKYTSQKLRKKILKNTADKEMAFIMHI
jgi:hypothetical protein